MPLNDDIITLGGVQFPITGIVTASAASDFETGIKVGKVSYDHRENAFFLVLDDFTGGFGSQYLDVREELGTYWYAGSQNSPETAYPGRVTLPLRQRYIPIPGVVNAYTVDTDRNPAWLERENYYLFAVADKLYSINSATATPVLRVSAVGQPISGLVAAVDAVEGVDRLYLSYTTGSPLMFSLNDGVTWNYCVPHWVQHDLWPPIASEPGAVLKKEEVNISQAGTTLVEHDNPDVIIFDPDGNQVLQPQPPSRIPVPFFSGWVGQITYNLTEGDTSGTQGGESILLGDGGTDVEFGQLGGAGGPGGVQAVRYTAMTDWINGIEDGSLVDNSSAPPIRDIFFWDYKLLGQWDKNKISFLVPGSGEGLVLTALPYGTYVERITRGYVDRVQVGASVEWETNPSVTLYAPDGSSYVQAVPDTGVVIPILVPNFGYYVDRVAHITDIDGWKYYLTEGQEPWNHQLENDEHIVAAIDIDHEIRFVGVMAAPWGEPAPYMRAGNRMYVLDFYSRKVFPVEVGSDKPLIASVMHGGIAVLTDGWSIYEFNPQSFTERDISLPSRYGTPPNLEGYQIISLASYDKELLAVLVNIDDNKSVLYRHNGIGWSQIGAVMDDFRAYYAFRATFPLASSSTIFTNRSQALIVPGVNRVTGQPGYYSFDLPTISHQPTVGLDTFGPSGARFYTGWTDGGFFDIYGTLLRMNTDSFFHNDDEKIIVEYRLDNDPEPEETATWTQLVDVSGVPSAFSSEVEALYFDNPDHPKKGIKFRTVQFRITLLRGSDATSSPELHALTLVYLKTPELRTQWAFTVDINRMTENTSGTDETFFIDGDVATLENVFAKFRELWTNDHVLIDFTVPSALGEDETFYVKLVAMPMSFDDFRRTVAGKGTIQIQLIEPVD
jgi:hypothetical protein